jgi:hypothetical protein
MTSARRYGLATLAVLACAATAHAQLPQAKLFAVFPPGAQSGQTQDVTVASGEDIDELSKLHFTHPGITAVQKTQDVGGVQQPIDNVFVVTVAADVPPGVYEVAAEGRFGATNTRRFVVGTRAEVNETEGNNVATTPSPLAFETVVIGRMDGGTDLDWFKFTATAGQRLVFDCAGPSIDSRITPTLEIYDAAGRRRLTHARSIRLQDATLVFDAPADGEYLLKLFDYTFRNGNDYFYRLTPRTGPHIAFVLPPSGTPGSTGNYTLYGFNLPGGQRTDVKLNGVALERLDTTIALPAEPTLLDPDAYVPSVAADTDAITFRLDSPQGQSNPVRVFFADAQPVVEQEPNNESAQAQAITFPVEVTGQFATRGDVDYVSFSAKAGDVLYIEAFGERLDSPADPVITIDEVTKDANGAEVVKRLGAQDDVATTLYQNVFDTQTDDAVYRLQVGSDATYRVSIRDRSWEVLGDPSRVYRLAIRPEQPDLRVVAVPMTQAPGQVSPVGLRQGDTFPVNILAFRQDGFIGGIDVTVPELPAGITCAGTTIGPNQITATLVFRAAADAAPAWHQIKLVATARVDNPAAVRAADTARANVTNAQKPLPDLQKAVDAENQKVTTATAARDAAKQAADGDPGDAGLAQKLQEAQAALDAATAAQQAAAQKLAAAQQAVTDAQAALAAAEQVVNEKAQNVTRAVRAGTVVWPFQNNAPATSRVSETLALSVMPEQAPFAIATDVFRVTANQSRQILIPVTIEKRNGFDENVALNFTGLPNNANIDAPNGQLDKGQTSKLLRVFVKENSPPGIYTFWMNTQGQVNYARNPEKAARLKTAHEALAAETKTAMEAATKATEVKNDATQKATAAAEAFTKSQTDQAAAQKAATDAATLVQQAQAVKDAADKKLADALAAQKKADDDLVAANKVLTDAETAVATADAAVKAAQTALDADPNNETLKKQKADADAALVAATQARDTAKTNVTTAEQTAATNKTAADAAQTEQTEAVKKLTEAQTTAKAADEALVKANEAVTKADADNKAAQELKTASEKAEQETQAAAKALEDRRKAAEKAATDADNAAKPQGKNFTPPSTPFIVEVRPAPVKLAANVPNSGNVKRGESIEIKVTVNRQNAFAGPVTLTLPLPPGVAGLSAPDVTVTADQTEGTLIVTAAADATEGQLANMVIQARMEFSGEAAVDVPITLTVQP